MSLLHAFFYKGKVFFFHFFLQIIFINQCTTYSSPFLPQSNDSDPFYSGKNPILGKYSVTKFQVTNTNKSTGTVSMNTLFLFVCLIWFFTSHQQSFSYIGIRLLGLNQYKARINVLAKGHNATKPVKLK